MDGPTAKIIAVKNVKIIGYNSAFFHRFFFE